MAKKKLPQSMQALIGEIGEQVVLLRLAIFAHNHRGWQVFRNVGASGYDILLSGAKIRKPIKIEVKTRQRLHTTSKRPTIANFYLTRGERLASDFLIAYWLERGEFYIVPAKYLKPVRKGKSYRFTVTLKKDNQPGDGSAGFLNKWALLHSDFN